MNVFQATLVFICFVAAKGSFPAVILDRQYLLYEPKILLISDTEKEIGYDYNNEVLLIACPLHPNQREEDAIPEVLKVVRCEFMTKKNPIYLDNQPRCELQPQVTFKQVTEAEEYNRYLIGYKVYYVTREDKDNSGGSKLYSLQDEYVTREVFTLNFHTATKQPISVEYNLNVFTRFISTASNQKHTFMYQKNEDFLEIDLDHLYGNFVDQILPRMAEEKTKNQLAHALGIQKLQLAAQDDFVLDTWKMATFWNINTAPIWRVLLLRWNAIEIYLRNLFKRNVDLKIETGVSGILELAGRYYDNDTAHKLHIPKYVWKLLPMMHAYKRAMLIVMHNDPFTEHQERLCEDVCAINGWLVSNNDYRTGIVYCCEITENIDNILGYSKNTRDYKVYSFTKESNGTENLKQISSFLSDSPKKIYDW